MDYIDMFSLSNLQIVIEIKLLFIHNTLKKALALFDPSVHTNQWSVGVIVIPLINKVFAGKDRVLNTSFLIGGGGCKVHSMFQVLYSVPLRQQATQVRFQWMYTVMIRERKHKPRIPLTRAW
jgi:hypothetical protein